MILLGLVGCNGAALPQASIPAPANSCSSGTGCITVSSPNSSGLVTVAGAAGAVPDSAIVEITLASSSSWLELFDSFCPSAYASSCSSNLAVCSTDQTSGSCQLTANDDGSFFTQIPASLTDTISIIYIDPSTCRTSQVFESVVSSAIVALALEGKAMTYSKSAGLGYIFAVTNSGDGRAVYTVDASFLGGITADLVTSFDKAGDPTSIDQLDNEDELLLETTEGTSIMSLTDNSLTNLAVGTELASPQHAYAQHGFTYPSASLFSSRDMSCLNSNHADTTVDRIFAIPSDTTVATSSSVPFYILDPTNATSVNGNYAATAVTYNFSSVSTHLSGLTLQSVKEIYISQVYNKGFFLANFSDGNDYFVEIPVQTGFCSTIIDSTLRVIQMPQTLTTPALFHWFGEQTLFDSEAENLLILADSATNALYAVDLSSETATLVTPDSLSGTSGITAVVPTNVPTGFPIDFAFLGSSNTVLRFEAAQTTDGTIVSLSSLDGFEIGANPEAMSLFTLFNISSTFSDVTSLEADFLSDARLVVLSNGVPGEGISFLRVINISDLP